MIKINIFYKNKLLKKLNKDLINIIKRLDIELHNKCVDYDNLKSKYDRLSSKYKKLRAFK